MFLPASPVSTPARVSASTHPRLPHPQGGPSTSMIWWPISPALPLTPVMSLPSIITPPPMPVPSVMATMLRQPRPAPIVPSARVNALASLIIATGSPSASEIG